MLNNQKNFSVIQEYSKALELLDNYDHQVVTKPEGLKKDTYQLTYEECRELIKNMVAHLWLLSWVRPLSIVSIYRNMYVEIAT